MMTSFFKQNIALWWAKRHVAQSQRYKYNAVEDQEKLLLALVKQAQHTQFGSAHGFANIRSAKDFQEAVPVRDYEALKPYINALLEGEKEVLWAGQPQYFAKTSGTTSGSKYIPISREGIRHQIQAAQSALLHYIYQTQKAGFVSGKMIFLQGSPQLDTLHGTKVGRLSGIVAHHIPSYLQNNRLPSWETNCIEDWEEKIETIVTETETQDMRLISGIPPWMIMYFERLIERNKGRRITQIFPNLQLLMTGGVNYEPYQEKMNELLGRPVDTLQTYPASEGFFAFQDNHQEEGLLLQTHHGIFYEFIPLDQLGGASPTRKTLRDVELHQDYALVLSTDSGLWAYLIGDVVRFISKDPYRILVSGRTKHYTSAFGEHVIAYEVEEAFKACVAQCPAQITEFHLAPEVNPQCGLPYHEWLIEFEKEPQDLALFSTILDQEMRKKNTYYNDLVSGNILRPLVITKLKKGAFQEYAKSQGKLGGQNKTPRLANDRTIADPLSLHKYP